MKKRSSSTKAKDSFTDLERFYQQKKKQQEALKKLLKALDEKSLKDDHDNSEH